jgi:DNA-directed RNA polymerase subunit N (RpoN/RPB10)
MIIPVRCYSCGKVIGSKYETYLKRVREKKMSRNLDVNKSSVIDINFNEVKKTSEGEVLDELGLTRYCCRKILLTNIDLINEI